MRGDVQAGRRSASPGGKYGEGFIRNSLGGHTLSSDYGRCPYCSANNARSNTVCVQCRERLPWAAWVEAARGTSQAPVPDNPDWQPQSWNDDVGLRADGPTTRLVFMTATIVLAVVVAMVAYHVLAGNGQPAASVNNAVNTVKSEASQANQSGGEANASNATS